MRFVIKRNGRGSKCKPSAKRLKIDEKTIRNDPRVGPKAEVHIRMCQLVDLHTQVMMRVQEVIIVRYDQIATV